MIDQTDNLTWRDTALGRVPVSARFDDPYYSLDNGLDETRYVFLAGNDLPARFADGFQIAELGFGTGLNFLATLQMWNAAGAPGHLIFTSFEAFPISAAQAQEALAAFPSLTNEINTLLARWSAIFNQPAALTDTVTLHVISGDARQALPAWTGAADAWFLDGFSPAKNPELWEPDLINAVALHTRPGGTVATYSAAGQVRRSLTDAGFTVQRVPGFGRKRHMTKGQLTRAS